MARGLVLGAAAAVALLTAGWCGAFADAGGVAAAGATLAPQAASGGWVVTSLRTDGAAARSGLHVGDVIDAVGDHAPGIADFPDHATGPVLLHVAARGDVGAHSLILRAAEVASREDPDRRGR
ncbi:hypothetical protein [Sphingomonas sp. T9W2]|uniref:hypothetical protein n=1 Tax=Sphingomonas sp. T9W2 TaxID=3143183 RepID=UPI0031F4D9B2